MKKLLGLSAILALGLSLNPAAQADVLRFAFVAEVFSFSADTNYDSSFTGPINNGDLITGFFQYDTSLPGDPRSNGGGNRAISAQVGNASIAYDGIGNFIWVDDNEDRTTIPGNSTPFENVDVFRFTVDTQGNETQTFGYAPGFSVYLVDTDQSVFSDESLPASLSLTDFEAAVLSLTYVPYRDGRLRFDEDFTVRANLVSLQAVAVPEPATAFLLGLGGLLASRRRTRRAT